SKYFMVSLMIQQLYREILVVADETGGKLKNRVVFYCDELGTLPAIDSLELVFSAARSRRLSMVPIIQSFAQLERNYGKEGSEIIVDNCQDVIFGGFAPNSQTAEVLSKALGSKTVMSGSISKGKNDPSQSLQMIERPLMTPDELKSIPKGNFIVMKTGTYPLKTKLKLFFEWGISFDKVYQMADKGQRKVIYASKKVLEKNILEKYPPPETAKRKI
ncbi:MAG: TraG/TraD/VirD4 family protein, partial [Eubacteriales bacterium]